MNGIFTGYGLVAVAVAIVISGFEPQTKYEKRAHVVTVAIWPIMVWGILEEIPNE